MNVETVRLLRSQLRSRSSMKVVNADILPLDDLALQGATSVAVSSRSANADNGAKAQNDGKDLESRAHVFANTALWRKLGEEYPEALVLTGILLFAEQTREALIVSDQERFDAVGRRRVDSARQWQRRRGFVFKPIFLFIDGRNGAVLHTETVREEVFYDEDKSVPALASYFELMDRILPRVLHVFTDHTIRGERYLLQ